VFRIVSRGDCSEFHFERDLDGENVASEDSMTLPNVRFRTTVRLAVLGVAATLSLALAETPAAVRKVTLVLASDVACTVKLDGEKVARTASTRKSSVSSYVHPCE
jgi:hypothetical protein